MSKLDWAKIQLFNKAVEGLNAIEELTGEKPAMGMVIVTQEARAIWNEMLDMYREFYELPIQERLYESGMATRPAKSKSKEQI